MHVIAAGANSPGAGRWMDTMKASLLIVSLLLAIAARGCAGNSPQRTFKARDRLEWYGATFAVGMSRAEAQTQLKDAVTEEDFDPRSKATLITDCSPLDRYWVFVCVPLEPVGKVLIAKLTFSSNTLARIEIVDECEGARRDHQGNPGCEEFSGFRVGMTKANALDQLRTAELTDKAISTRPNEKELASDVWEVGWYDPTAGASTTMRLRFEGGRLKRIHVITLQ